MAWARIDDALGDHHKIIAAGELLGANGPAVAIGLYIVGLLWANKHLSDGFLPGAVVKQFRQCDRPLRVAGALVKAGLWEQNGSDGFQIHDYKDFNFSASDVRRIRAKDRARKRRFAKNRWARKSHGKTG